MQTGPLSWQKLGSAVGPVHTYRLKFFDDPKGVAKDVEFETHDAAQALVIAQREAGNRTAELWRDGRKICTVKRLDEGAWEIHTPMLS